MPQYAAKTSVPIEKSRAEIEGTLRRYGADGFRSGWAERGGRRVEQIEFTVGDRLIRFTLVMPSRDDPEITRTPERRVRRSAKTAREAWEQACRQRWRALALAIKAKLEAVECGITEFEDEFLAQIVDPQSGRTMSQIVRPQIDQVYTGLDVQIGLPGLPAPEQFSEEV